MNSSVIKASECTSARCRSSGDRASPITPLVDKNIASFVQIYPPDHNILDFLQSYFQIHFLDESWVSPAFPTPLQIWKYCWIWSQQAFFFEKWVCSEYGTSIERPGKLKTLLSLQISKDHSVSFSLNIYSVYGSQQRQKREVINIFLEFN